MVSSNHKRSNLVTLNSYSVASDAHSVKGYLESKGIEVFIINENIVTVDWRLSNAVGGIKLQVKNTDIEKSQIFLDEYQHLTKHNSKIKIKKNWKSGDVCPYCHSEEVSAGTYKLGQVILASLVFWIPLIFMKKEYRCYDCSDVWKS